MRSTSGMKPMSSMRSASSSTTHVDAAQQHLAAVEPVEQAAGRGDQDVDALLQRLFLVAHADAADQQRHGQVEILAVDLEILAPSGSRARASARGSASAASAPGPGRWPGCAASAGRTRPSCRCRSGRCRSRRGRRGPRGWHRPGSAWAWYSPRRRWPSGPTRRDRGPQSRAGRFQLGSRRSYRLQVCPTCVHVVAAPQLSTKAAAARARPATGRRANAIIVKPHT